MGPLPCRDLEQDVDFQSYRSDLSHDAKIESAVYHKGSSIYDVHEKSRGFIPSFVYIRPHKTGPLPLVDVHMPSI